MGCVKENVVRVCEERNVGSLVWLNAGFVETEYWIRQGKEANYLIQMKKLTFPDSLLGPSQAECSLQNKWALE